MRVNTKTIVTNNYTMREFCFEAPLEALRTYTLTRCYWKYFKDVHEIFGEKVARSWLLAEVTLASDNPHATVFGPYFQDPIFP